MKPAARTTKHWRAITSIMVLVPVFLWGGIPLGHLRAAEQPTVMVLFDGSGSMWGKLGDETQTKLALSQQYLLEALPKAKPGVKFGLASFGHRRAGSCSDAQVIVPPGDTTVDQISELIRKHNPRGKGPVTLALRETVGVLPADAEGGIVLIHDGVDNCRQDPCQMAAKLSQSHPKIAVHVISLDLAPEEARSMSCVAAETGGKATVARSAAELQKAIGTAMRLAMLQPQAPATAATEALKQPPVAAQNPSKGPPRIRLAAHLTDGDQHRIRDVAWTLKSPANAKEIVLSERATELSEKVPAGRYVVTAKAGLATAEQQITVGKEGETNANVTLNAGILTFRGSVSEEATANSADPVFLTLRHRAGGDPTAINQPFWIGIGEPETQLIVPAGTFDLDVEHGHMKKTVTVAIEPGKTHTVDASLDGGLLILDSMIAVQPGSEEWATSDTPKISYVISTDDPAAPGGRREVGRSASPRAKFQLAPGTFYAEAEFGEAKSERRFAIGGGQVIHHQFQFDVARVSLKATVGTTQVPDSVAVTYKVMALEPSGKRLIVTTSEQAPDIVLPQGRYRFEAEAAGRVRGQSADVSLSPGASVEVPIPLQAGQVTLQAGGGSAALPRIQLRNQDGAVVWHGRVGRTTTMVLAPGTYAMEHKASQNAQAQTFSVKDGEKTVLSVTPKS